MTFMKISLCCIQARLVVQSLTYTYATKLQSDDVRTVHNIHMGAALNGKVKLEQHV
jgi:hypothetical protein